MSILRARTLVVIILMSYINNGFAQTRLNARVAKGTATCAEIGCEESDPELIETRDCLNCKYHEAKIMMDSILRVKEQKFSKEKKDFRKILQDQKEWEKAAENQADKVSNEYKGGTMEIDEYVRTKLKLTIKRTEYLKRL